MRRWSSPLVPLSVLALALALLAAPALAEPPSADADTADLSRQDASRLLQSARAVRAGLDEMRRLRARDEPAPAARVADLQARIEADFSRFLELAGLTADEFVRLVDADQGLDPDARGDEKPVLRVLRPVDR